MATTARKSYAATGNTQVVQKLSTLQERICAIEGSTSIFGDADGAEEAGFPTSLVTNEVEVCYVSNIAYCLQTCPQTYPSILQHFFPQNETSSFEADQVDWIDLDRYNQPTEQEEQEEIDMRRATLESLMPAPAKKGMEAI